MYWVEVGEIVLLIKSHRQPLLERAVGSKLSEASYMFHRVEGELSPVIAIHLGFGGASAFRLGCASDWESLSITTDPLEEGDLGEAGEFVILDAARLDPAALAPCIGATLRRVTVDLWRDRPCALKLAFDDSAVFVANVGDDLVFDEMVFRRMVAEEELEPLDTVCYEAEG